MSLKIDEQFGRPALELVSGLIWFLSAIVTALFGYYGNFGFRFLLLASIPMFVIALYRLYQGWQVLDLKAKTQHLAALKITIHDLDKMVKKNPNKVYYGHGFEWERLHTQLAIKFTESFVEAVKPPAWFMKLKKFTGFKYDMKAKGKTYLHAIGGSEKPIMRPLSDRVTHRVLGGASGTGKGRAMVLDIVQAILRKEPTIIIDPKKDELMMHLAYASCVLSGRPNSFSYFDPTKPRSSVRIDLLSHFTDLEELTTRVVDILPPKKDDQFKQFAWRAINTVVYVLHEMGEHITLFKIRMGVQEEVAVMVKKLGLHLLSQHASTLEFAEAVNRQADVNKAAVLAVEAYNRFIAPEHPSVAMSQVISIYAQDQRHYQKLIQNIIPLLMMLTQGEYKSLLSPDYDDDDPRPIVNLRKLDERGETLYVNTAALKDNAIGSALGSLIMNDTVGLISDRYYFNEICPNTYETIVNVFCDEAGDVLNHNSTMLINKSRGANCHFTIAFQALSDIQKRLGSAEDLNIIMGSAANKSQARSEDPHTRETMSAQMGTTASERISRNHMTQSVAQRDDLSFNTSYSTAVNSEQVQIVSEDSFKGLADLHLFMQVAGTYLYKIRVPFITVPDELKYDPAPYENARFGNMPAFEDVGSTGPDDLKFNNNDEEQAA